MNISKIIDGIDVDKFLKYEMYNKELFDKLNTTIREIGAKPEPVQQKMKTGKYIKYKESCVEGFNSVMNNLKKCQDKIESIGKAVKGNDNQNNLNDKNSNIMKTILAIQEVFTKLINELQNTIDNFEVSTKRVHTVVDASTGGDSTNNTTAS